MSTKERTLQEIETEYGTNCARAGDIQYRISLLTDELTKVNQILKNLNNEAASLSTSQGDK